jgi:hypothetical protein
MKAGAKAIYHGAQPKYAGCACTVLHVGPNNFLARVLFEDGMTHAITSVTQ